MSKSRKIRWTGHVASTGKAEKYVKNFGNRILGRPSRRCDDDIKIGVKET